jgi:hypothetical protein
VEEAEDHDSVVVFLGDGYDIKVLVFVEVEEVVFLVLDNGPTIGGMDT